MDKTLFKKINELAIPSVIESLLATIVMYADTAMVGAIGANASAAIGLTTTARWLSLSPLWSMSVGVIACISKSLGANDKEKASIAGIQAIYLALIVGTIMGALTCSIAFKLPTWLGAEEAIRYEASYYYFLLCSVMIFQAFTHVLGAALLGASDAKTPMKVNGAMNIMNVILNYFLIFNTHQVFGITVWGANMGVIGAGIASAFSYVFGGTLMLICFIKHPTMNFQKVSKGINGNVTKEIISISLPVTLQNLGQFSGQVIFTKFVTHLGTIALAAHSIALSAEELFYIPGFGIETATSTLCGNALGEKDKEKVMRTAKTTEIMAFVVMMIMGAILFFFASNIMSIFTQDSKVISLGAKALKIVAVSEPIYGAQIILNGAFNGVGDTKAPFLISLFTMYGIRLLGTYICVYHFHLGLEAVWVCMVCDNVAKFLIYEIRYKRGRWIDSKLAE